ncbi:MAG: transcriptional repressor [Candidatus Rokubacteria bacterium]|nr:transcriptional repressor [Candidatus Rokubacteria bacterium]
MRPAPVAEVDRIRGLLQDAGHAWTRPRSAVLHVLVVVATPLKVEEIHDRLGRRSGGRGINLSSVYRTLNLLHALGVVRRVQLGDGAQRYELAEGYRAHHHHLVCEACGRIEDVRGCPLEGTDLGVTVRSHHLELFGLCRGCAREERAEHVRV